MSAESALASDSSVFWNDFAILGEQHWLTKSFKGRGELSFAGSFRFSGEWTGSIQSSTPDSHLFIMPGSKIAGRIDVARITIEGELSDVDIKADWFRARTGARINGTVSAKTLVLEEGAFIEGRIVSLER